MTDNARQAGLTAMPEPTYLARQEDACGDEVGAAIPYWGESSVLALVERIMDLEADRNNWRDYVESGRATDAILAAQSADASDAATGQGLTDDSPVTDAMVYAFHRATTDGPLGEADFNEIRDALRAALLAAPAAPAPKCEHDLRAEYQGENGASAAICAKCQERVQTGPAPAAQADGLAAKLRSMSDESEKQRLATDNPNVERIFLGMRDAYDVAANLAAQRQQSATPAEPVAAAKADQMADRQYRAGFLSGWNAGVEGDTDKLRGVQNRVGPLSAYLDTTPADASSEADKRDAERYRHLRNCNGGALIIVHLTGIGEDDQTVLTEGDADEVIDAVIQRERQQGAQSNG